MGRAALTIIAALSLALAGVTAWGAWEHSRRVTALARIDSLQRASAANLKATQELRAKERADYVERASRADHAYAAALAAARLRTDDFIARRVRPSGGQCATIAVSAPGAAPVPAPVPTPVIMDASDVRAAADIEAYALACRGWALSIGE